jgi:hypothetical protein
VATEERDAQENERAVQAIQREEEGHEGGMVKFVQKLVGGAFLSLGVSGCCLGTGGCGCVGIRWFPSMIVIYSIHMNPTFSPPNQAG